jgi:hypothetical protein
MVASCGRVSRDPTPSGPNDNVSDAGPDTILLGSQDASDGAANRPPSLFVDASCFGGTGFDDGNVHCVTRTELERNGSQTVPRLLLDGGIGALGSESAWRCPELTEITFAACGLSEGCCAENALCGPVVERAPFDGGESSDAEVGDQLCCYYTFTVCGV